SRLQCARGKEDTEYNEQQHRLHQEPTRSVRGPPIRTTARGVKAGRGRDGRRGAGGVSRGLMTISASSKSRWSKGQTLTTELRAPARGGKRVSRVPIR